MTKKKGNRLQHIKVELTEEHIELMDILADGHSDDYFGRMLQTLEENGARVVFRHYNGDPQCTAFFDKKGAGGADTCVSGYGEDYGGSLVAVYYKLHSILDWDVTGESENGKETKRKYR